MPLECFHDAWGKDDESQLKVVIGSPRHQATFEALGVLVATRLWRAVWCTRPTTVTVRSDATAALAALEKLRSRNPAMNRVARELALDVTFAPAGLSFRPKHVPGATNEWSDA